DYPAGAALDARPADPFRGEVQVRRRDGGRSAAWASVSAVRRPDGAVTHYVAIVTDISRIKDSQRRLEELANYDALSGLPNRNLLQDRFGHAVEAARRV